MAGVNGIEIEIGQLWRCRDGKEVKIECHDEWDTAYPWGTACGEWYQDDGHWQKNTDVSCYDLIELVQDENGFTIWRGGECPVPAGAKVSVRFRNGQEITEITGPEALALRWDHSTLPGDIVAYKLIEQPAASDPKDMAADMLSDLGWHFDGTTWVQDEQVSFTVEAPQADATVKMEWETPDSALAVQVGGSHYKDLAIQPIEYIHANKLGFCEGNVVKYITRHRQKHGADDIRKVIHYCQLLLELEYGGAK